MVPSMPASAMPSGVLLGKWRRRGAKMARNGGPVLTGTLARRRLDGLRRRELDAGTLAMRGATRAGFAMSWHRVGQTTPTGACGASYGIRDWTPSMPPAGERAGARVNPEALAGSGTLGRRVAFDGLSARRERRVDGLRCVLTEHWKPRGCGRESGHGSGRAPPSARRIPIHHFKSGIPILIFPVAAMPTHPLGMANVGNCHASCR